MRRDTHHPHPTLARTARSTLRMLAVAVAAAVLVVAAVILAVILAAVQAAFAQRAPAAATANEQQDANNEEEEDDAPSSPTPLAAPVGDPNIFTQGERPFVPGALSDAEIERRLAAAYARLVTLEAVEVDVEAGIVSLTGTALRPSARARAEAIAWRLPGVLDVENLISLPETVDVPGAEAERTARDEAIQERLVAIFGRVGDLEDVTISVEGGVVSLGGTVPVADASRTAEEFATNLEGVIFVDNNIEVARHFTERLRPTLEHIVEFVENAVLYLPLIAVSLVVLGLFMLLARLLQRADFLYRRISRQPLVQNIARQVVGSLVMLVGVVLVLDILNVTTLVGAVLGTAGLATLAIGFAFRDIVENYLASLMLSIRRPFYHNDLIRLEEYEGRVVRLTTRDTVLMTQDGIHVRIPNAIVFKSIIENFSRNPRRRFKIGIGVGFDQDIARAQKVGLAALRKMPNVLDDPAPNSRVDTVAEREVRVNFLAWVDQSQHDFLNVEAEARRRLKDAFDRAGIPAPEPAYRINVCTLNEPPRRAPGLTLDYEDDDLARSLDSDEPCEPCGPTTTRPRDDLDASIEQERRTSGERDLLDE